MFIRCPQPCPRVRLFISDTSVTNSLVTLQLASSVTPWDVLLSLIAAATHDLDHPGVNQPFLIKTNHYLATLYKVSTILSWNLIFLHSRKCFNGVEVINSVYECWNFNQINITYQEFFMFRKRLTIK